MEDVQSRPDDRQVPIDQVGVCDLRYPITVLDRRRAGRMGTSLNRYGPAASLANCKASARNSLAVTAELP